MGLLRLIIAATVGAYVLRALPRAGVLASTQEIIAFLSLIMAGLLPAMILTATIMRGSGLSARRVDEYGGALKAQLTFWAMVFASAGFSTLGITAAKIFSTPGASFAIGISRYTIDAPLATGWSLWLAGAGLGIVLMRLRAAYIGLVSLLDLNMSMSRTEALLHDRSLRDAIGSDALRAASSTPYERQGER